jgi:hypothetical protein
MSLPKPIADDQKGGMVTAILATDPGKKVGSLQFSGEYIGGGTKLAKQSRKG